MSAPHLAQSVYPPGCLQIDNKADSKGLIPQCVEGLFSSIKELEGNGSKILVFISFIEIYQEHVRDLGKAVTRLQETGVPRTAGFCTGSHS